MTKLLFTLILLVFTGCGSYNQELVNSGIAAGVAAGLQFGVKDAAKRTVIANYGYVGAKALRSVTGNPTPDELAQLITAWIPADVKAEYGALIPLILPPIISAYKVVYDKYGKTGQTAKLYEALNGIAGAVETGCSLYSTGQATKIALVYGTIR